MVYFISTKNQRMDDDEEFDTIQRKVRVLDLIKLRAKKIVE